MTTLNEVLEKIEGGENLSEITKLWEYLGANGYNRRPGRGWPQVIVTDNNGNWLWDAVCSEYSYGGNEGLLEVMEHTDVNYVLTDEERECDDVLGWLTAQDIVERLEAKSSE